MKPTHVHPSLSAKHASVRHVLPASHASLATCITCVTCCRYHTGPGFFINTHLIFVTVSATVWVYMILVLTNTQTYRCGGTNANPVRCSYITGAAPTPRLPAIAAAT